MKNFALALSGLAAISAAPAFAETTYLSFGLGYSELSIDDETLATTSGFAAFERTTGKLTYGGELSGSKLSDDDDETNISEVSAYLGYDVTSAITVFVGASSLEIDGSELTTLNAGAEYTSGAFTFGAAYFTGDADDADFDGGQVYAEYNANDLSAYVAVMFDDEDEIYFAGVSRDVDAYEVDLDATFMDGVDIYKLSGSYNIRDNVRLNASVDLFNMTGDDLNQTSFGAGYMVTDDIWIDASYDTIEVNGESIDGFGLKVSFETGKETLRAADRVTTVYDVLSSVPLLGSL